MTKDTLQLSQKWRDEGLRYASEVNAYVRRGLESNWEEPGEEPSEDSRRELASQVYKIIKQANKTGELETLREQFPAASWPFGETHRQLMRAVCPIAFLHDGTFLVAAQNEDLSRTVYVMDKQRAIRIEHVQAASCSADGRDIALMDEQGVRVVRGPDRELNGTLLATYTWAAIIDQLREKYPDIETLQPHSYRNADVIPFTDGTKLLMVSHDGIYVIEEAGALLLHPAADNIREWAEEEDELTASLSMPHGAVSRSGRWMAYGSQDSGHLLLDQEKWIVYPFEPISSYPHYSLFSANDENVWFNACHFYNGCTIGISLPAIEQDDLNKEPSSIDDSMRVYAGVALQKGNIMGDAYGYLRMIDLDGNELWRYYVSGTISGMALHPDETTLLVGTYNGMLHVLDLTSTEPSPYEIGTSSIRESYRWIIWDTRKPLCW
ncbi:PQQ-binding-like beta-propeller repeat protein [Cohnella boryungensis]|uniref:PQQ-binding-like beta-propeller repeat protein n=1 Tax=Cohnella boryungensis TaxID=768479 RepID=A0ABV8SIA4_9BACL